MVAGYEDDLRPLARLAQQLLDDVVMGLWPVPGATQAPAVDDVADQIQPFAFRVAQEI